MEVNQPVENRILNLASGRALPPNFLNIFSHEKFSLQGANSIVIFVHHHMAPAEKVFFITKMVIIQKS